MINKLFRDHTSDIRIQFFRYFFVGGAAFVVDFGLLYLLTEYASLHYTFSASLSFIVGLAVNYLISIYWVFNERTLKSRFWEFVIYGIIGVVGLVLNVAILWCMTEYVQTHYLLSKIVATFVVFVWNFSARRFILFDDSRKK